ncbi:MAG: S-layer homology domain-containing protein [Acutalibacter sp.]|nr:S-layer homology domain-containing protein [Acutalibacter sp.]
MKKFTKMLAFLLTLVLVLSLIPVSASAATVTERESNDTFAEAQSITLGDTISGSISVKGDVDNYTFTLRESGKVTIDVTAYMEHYSVLLFDEEGTRLWYDDYNSWNASVGFQNDKYDLFLEKGTYYWQVKGSYRYNYSSEYTGTYTIGTSFTSAQATESEPNNSIAQANSITLGSQIRGVIAENGDHDFYKFTLTSSGKVSLDFTAYMQYYSLLLFDGSGNSLWVSAGKEWNSTVGFRNDKYDLYMEIGTYYLQVKGSSSSSFGSRYPGFYTIGTSFTSAAATEIEPNNSAAQANAVNLGDSIRGVAAINRDYDFYRVTLTGADKVFAEITSYMPSYNLYLFDEAGKEVWHTSNNKWNESTGYVQNTHTVSLEAGTYYFRVSSYYSDQSGSYTLKIYTESTQQQQPSQTGSFVDVPTSQYYYSAVEWAVENGITAGTSPTRFSPSKTCTRAEVVTFLWRAAGSPEPTSTQNPFTDVPSGQYYTKAVLWAVERGITAGTSATRFSPSKTCTRGEVVSFLYRYEGKPDVSGSNTFRDVPAGQFYYNPVLWAVANSITAGTTPTTFSPNQTCTRAQIVTFLYRDLK